ncbi:MAG: FtsK/SpoIIIE domain-containing protein, partial [Conexibacter sp.]
AVAAAAQVRRHAECVQREQRDEAQARLRAIELDVAHRRTREREALARLLEPLASRPALAAWDAPAWQRPPEPDRPPALVRIGAARLPGASAAGVELPLLTPGIGAGHLIVRAAAARRADALGLVQAVALRVLASLPPGHVRFRVHDPAGIGASLGAFGGFPAPQIRHGLPTTDGIELRAVLEELVDRSNEISVQHLRGTYASLADFLDVAGHGHVAYELLVLLDYPTAVDRDAAELLGRLAATAASRGTMLIVHESEQARGGVRAELPQATVVHCDDGGVWHSSLLPSATFAPDPPPPTALIDAVAQRPLPEAPPVRFDEVTRDEAVWGATSGEGLAVTIGRAGLDAVELRFDDDTPHGLVAGDPGSGKSNLLRAAVYGLAHRHAPTELHLYLLDFKEGVEFREFAPSAGDPTFLPHAQVVSTNSSRAFGVAVLEHLAELTRVRYAQLPDDAKKLSALRVRHPDRVLPRVLLVIDEFHVLFDRGDQLADRAATALTALAKQGRAAGVHFLLATQAIGSVGAGNPTAARLGGVFDAARLRVALRLSEGESHAILRLGNRAAAELHERGVAIVNRLQGDESGNVRTRVALIDDDIALRERRDALARAVGARRPPRVFDGHVGADPARNQQLRMALGGRAQAAERTWLGADVAIDVTDPAGYPPVTADFVPDLHRHLAVLGAGARAAVAALQWAAVGLGASDRATRFLLLDALRPDDDAPAGAVAATAATLRALGCVVDVESDRRAGPLVARLERELEQQGSRRAVVVFGFDRLTGLGDPLEDPGELYPPIVRSAFEQLLERAGVAGLHLLAWWSTFDAFEQAVSAAQQSLFGIRVYLAVPEQRLTIATGGAADEGLQWPLALVQDAALGGSPRALHLFEPFGAAAPPAFLDGAAA